MRTSASIGRRCGPSPPHCRGKSLLPQRCWRARGRRDERQILGRYFVGTRLTEIPVNRSSRTVVLERLAAEFEVGLRYTEKQVNSTIQTFHADYAALRRYMVDEGFLTRAEGSYWRSGGRVDITYDRSQSA